MAKRTCEFRQHVSLTKLVTCQGAMRLYPRTHAASTLMHAKHPQAEAGVGWWEFCFSRARSVAQAILSATLRVSELAVVTAVTWRASSMHEIAYHDCSIVQGGPDVNKLQVRMNCTS